MKHLFGLILFTEEILRKGGFTGISSNIVSLKYVK